MTNFTYKNSGVDIEKADRLVDRISGYAKSTKIPGVLGGIGSFGSLFEIDTKTYPDPVLVSGTDGVGTKLEIAIKLNNFSTIGQDLVAMCVNDILTLGAKPLFFLDYFATGALDIDQAATVIKSIADACKDVECALAGGETAEMPGFYKKGDFDIAGFSVGIVSKSKIIDGSRIKAGDAIIGLPSSGLHSNGYSLARKIVKDKLDDNYSLKIGPNSETIGELLIKPTNLYVRELIPFINEGITNGLAHITGGGLTGNVPRILPDGLCAQIDISNYQRPFIFDYLQKTADLSGEEMLSTFNCGVGMVLFCRPENKESILKSTQGSIIGEVTSNSDSQINVKL